MRITGMMVYYYFVCKRKLWYFTNDIQMENTSEAVKLGKMIDETSYDREEKHILIDDTIQIDFLQSFEILHEVKKSRAVEEASIWQVKYYLYFLEERGIHIEYGVLDYPKIKQREKVFLEEGDESRMVEILAGIRQICRQKKPPVLEEKGICKKCAYYEFCFI